MQLLEQWMKEEITPRSEAVIAIRGMQEPRSQASARSALSLIKGVDAVRVSMETGRATIYFDPRKVDAKQFRVALGAVGLSAEILDPMTCALT
jgi:copper chaperone CopZ